VTDVRRILCPIDFSDVSRHALAHAAALARAHGAELTVLHVAPVMPVGTAFPPLAVSAMAFTPRIREGLRDELRAFAPADLAGLAPRFVVRDGPVVPEIVAEARAGAADLVVVGTHGRRGVERLVLGSVAGKLLHRAPCPVLVVPDVDEAAPAARGPRHVVCALDLSDRSADTLAWAVWLAQQARARLTVLHVVDWPEHDQPGRHAGLTECKSALWGEAMERLRAVVPAAAREDGAVVETVVLGTPWREILRVAGEEGADLLVLGAQGRGGLERVLFGSTAGHVVRQASCPVFLVRPRERDQAVPTAPDPMPSARVGC
jgi:nucleotide-binding universal stress UspA family protein